jgi:positive regulator of sigma E activity
MFSMFIGLVIIVCSIIGTVKYFNKDWTIFFIFIILIINSAFHFVTHFRRRFVDKYRN